MCAFVDHGPAGTGEPLAALLRAGNAGSNTAIDHITVAATSLKQLPRAHRRGRKTLIRTDTAGGTHAFLTWVTKRGRWLSYSVGMTITPTGQLADLELRHRRRARAEDRIHAAKDTGLANLPLHGFAANQVWIELVMLALDLLAWAQMLALAGHAARRWEPKRLRLRLFSAAARLVRSGRGRLLRFNHSWPWAEVLSGAIVRVRLLAAPT